MSDSGGEKLEILRSLRERFNYAERTLYATAKEEGLSHDRVVHLNSKAEGVALALSYLDEEIRNASR